MENPIKIDDLGVTLFLDTSISYLHKRPIVFHVFLRAAKETILKQQSPCFVANQPTPPDAPPLRNKGLNRHY